MAIVRRLFMALLLGVHRIHSAEAAAALYPYTNAQRDDAASALACVSVGYPRYKDGASCESCGVARNDLSMSIVW
jgi:hypothetical protein